MDPAYNSASEDVTRHPLVRFTIVQLIPSEYSVEPLGLLGMQLGQPVYICIVSSSPARWLRPLTDLRAPQFFQGDGVRLKEPLPNIGIWQPCVPVALHGP